MSHAADDTLPGAELLLYSSTRMPPAAASPSQKSHWDSACPGRARWCKRRSRESTSRQTRSPAEASWGDALSGEGIRMHPARTSRCVTSDRMRAIVPSSESSPAVLWGLSLLLFLGSPPAVLWGLSLLLFLGLSQEAFDEGDGSWSAPESMDVTRSGVSSRRPCTNLQKIG